MKFPLVLLRRKAVQAIHDRSRALDKKNRDLVDENNSLNMVIKRRDQQIVLLKDKCSRVGISQLENHIVKLQDEITRQQKLYLELASIMPMQPLIMKVEELSSEALSHFKLQKPDGTGTPVLSNALVQNTAGQAAGDIGHAEGPHTGSLQKVLGLEVPGSHLA